MTADLTAPGDTGWVDKKPESLATTQPPRQPKRSRKRTRLALAPSQGDRVTGHSTMVNLEAKASPMSVLSILPPPVLGHAHSMASSLGESMNESSVLKSAVFRRCNADQKPWIRRRCTHKDGSAVMVALDSVVELLPLPVVQLQLLRHSSNLIQQITRASIDQLALQSQHVSAAVDAMLLRSVAFTACHEVLKEPMATEDSCDALRSLRILQMSAETALVAACETLGEFIDAAAAAHSQNSASNLPSAGVPAKGGGYTQNVKVELSGGVTGHKQRLVPAPDATGFESSTPDTSSAVPRTPVVSTHTEELPQVPALTSPIANMTVQSALGYIDQLQGEATYRQAQLQDVKQQYDLQVHMPSTPWLQQQLAKLKSQVDDAQRALNACAASLNAARGTHGLNVQAASQQMESIMPFMQPHSHAYRLAESIVASSRVKPLEESCCMLLALKVSAKGAWIRPFLVEAVQGLAWTGAVDRIGSLNDVPLLNVARLLLQPPQTALLWCCKREVRTSLLFQSLMNALGLASAVTNSMCELLQMQLDSRQIPGGVAAAQRFAQSLKATMMAGNPPLKGVETQGLFGSDGDAVYRDPPDSGEAEPLPRSEHAGQSNQGSEATFAAPSQAAASHPGTSDALEAGKRIFSKVQPPIAPASPPMLTEQPIVTEPQVKRNLQGEEPSKAPGGATDNALVQQFSSDELAEVARNLEMMRKRTAASSKTRLQISKRGGRLHRRSRKVEAAIRDMDVVIIDDSLSDCSIDLDQLDS